MQQVTIRFDEVFDVVHGAARDRTPGTLFSFRCGTRREYGVRVPGKPHLHADMTVTALLARPGDWQSLIGWVDRDTGEIACQGRGALVFVQAGLLFAAALPLMALHQAPEASAVGAAALLFFLYVAVQEFRSASRAVHLLRAIQSSLPYKRPAAHATPRATRSR